MLERTKPVVCVESMKGGSGKSTFSTIAVGWHAMHDDKQPILIETDPVNSDVALVYAEDMGSINETHKGKKCDIHIFNTVHPDEEEARSACVALVDTIANNPDRAIVVNAPARNTATNLLADIYDAIDPDMFFTMFMLDADFMAAVMLNDYLSIVKAGKLCAIKNENHGKDFSDFDNTKIGQSISRNDASVTLRKIHKDIIHLIKSTHTGYHELDERLTFAQKCLLGHQDALKIYEDALQKAAPISKILADKEKAPAME